MKDILNILIAIIPLVSQAQKQENIWYFGRYAGLDFNSGIPVALTNGQTYSPDGTPVEGTAVISDSSGSLLFYTNGMKVWNKNQQVMPNGDSLLGNFSSTQAALIVPQPGNSRYFYIFTTDAFYNSNLKYGFRYSVVDVCLDGGLGDIISNQKNIKLLDTVAEKLTAVRHANGIDYWIITHKYFSDAFYSYHLSSSGIVDTIISHIGSTHPDTSTVQVVGAAIGEMKGSPNGQKLAIVNGNSGVSIAEYFDFNKSTGIVSNCVSIQTNPIYNYYGVSFSTDNSKLYISCWLNNNGIYQFDLNAGSGNPDSVKASKTQIVANGGYFGMQLGPDGKLYLAKTVSQYLSVINNPNNLGLSCNYVDSAIYLNGDTSNFGLPNIIAGYDYSNTTYACPTGVEDQEQDAGITIYPNPSDGRYTVQTENFKITNLEISNVLGEQIYSTPRLSPIIDLSSQPDGFYFIHIKTVQETVVKKIIINK